ncbi:tetratricopeptide repeat-containing diguanylate cyclase [Cellulomonas sp. IC4_254]|uniref:diguanylate cyclase n=1 Tax=Cellulomonas sp. IC4_254 TaxID=2714040 RepID=UPI0014218D1E|nr:GGDEF domain-containing protein [Cellulomonas sp. IC4_254]
MTSAWTTQQEARASYWRSELARVDRLCDAAPALCVAAVPALIAEARAERVVPVEIELEYNSGWAHHLLGEDVPALAAMERALHLATTHGLRAWEGRLLQGLAAVYNGFGDNLSALELLDRSLTIRRELHDTGGLAAALNNLADTYISMGRFPDKARELLDEAARLWPELDRPDGTCATLTGLAKLDTDESEALAGTDPVRSRALAERAVRQATEGLEAARGVPDADGGSTGNPRMAAEAQVRLARAQMALGDLDAAEAALADAETALPRVAARYLTIRYHAAHGRLRRLRGDYAGARATLTTGLLLTEQSLRPMERADVLLELVQVHEDAGDLRAALQTHREYHEAVMAQRDQAAERRGIVVNAQLDIERVRQGRDQARKRAAELAALNESLRHDAAHDALTGLLNRRGLDAIVTARLGHEADLAYVVADLDLFKSVNDQHSHPVGDEVLRRVAQIMIGAVRVGDVVARVGGEEFTLVLLDSPQEQAQAVCERIRTTIEGFPWHELSPDLHVTMSFGGAMAEPDEPAAGLVARADAALYRAKRLGRNRVVFDRELPEQPTEPGATGSATGAAAALHHTA